MQGADPVLVVDYDPDWPARFAALRDRATAALGLLALSVEHVGSTAVPGLPAKPVIDLDVVVASRAAIPEAVAALARLGYVHRGDLGIAGREAFRSPPSEPRHHLYVCPVDNPMLHQHLALRDYLRSHPDVARAYGDLKRALAARHGRDRDAYGRAKSAFVEAITKRALQERAARRRS